jgi:hypothetical protein
MQCVLDRVLVSPKWETHFPLTVLRATTCLGSDHTPLVLDTGSRLSRSPNRFFFETSWLELPGLKEMVVDHWITQAAGMRRC